jgi:alpha-mannosidase
MAFKRSFDGQDWVLRCFESHDEDAELQVRVSECLGLSEARISETNLLEREAKPLEVDMAVARVPLRGFEIKTLRFGRR